MTEPANDPVPPAVRDILALFTGELREQRFGDLDHEELAALADATRARAKEVERARDALESALAELDAAREALTTRAKQGLAYAAVFAASDPELSAKIAALEAASKRTADKPRATRRKSAPKRARGPREDAQASELPFDEHAVGAA